MIKLNGIEYKFRFDCSDVLGLMILETDVIGFKVTFELKGASGSSTFLLKNPNRPDGFFETKQQAINACYNISHPCKISEVTIRKPVRNCFDSDYPELNTLTKNFPEPPAHKVIEVNE